MLAPHVRASLLQTIYRSLPTDALTDYLSVCLQIQSNALAALQAICPETAERILAKGCITGDRINGLCDGETGKW